MIFFAHNYRLFPQYFPWPYARIQVLNLVFWLKCSPYVLKLSEVPLRKPVLSSTRTKKKPGAVKFSVFLK